MKKLLPLLLAALLALTACGADTPAASTPDQSTPPAASVDSSADVSADPSVDAPAPITDGDLNEAYAAAEDYYEGTVYQMISIDPIDTVEGEVSFEVFCLKGMEELPPRTISLARQNGVWEVVNEGY